MTSALQPAIFWRTAPAVSVWTSPTFKGSQGEPCARKSVEPLRSIVSEVGSSRRNFRWSGLTARSHAAQPFSMDSGERNPLS